MDIKTSDFFHLMVTALTLVGWGVLLWSLMLFHEARPEMSTLLTKFHQIEVRQHWLSLVYDKIMVLLWFCAGISFVAIFFNWYARKSDPQSGWVAQVLLFTVATVAIAVLTIWQPLMK